MSALQGESMSSEYYDWLQTLRSCMCLQAWTSGCISFCLTRTKRAGQVGVGAPWSQQWGTYLQAMTCAMPVLRSPMIVMISVA